MPPVSFPPRSAQPRGQKTSVVVKGTRDGGHEGAGSGRVGSRTPPEVPPTPVLAPRPAAFPGGEKTAPRAGLLSLPHKAAGVAWPRAQPPAKGEIRPCAPRLARGRVATRVPGCGLLRNPNWVVSTVVPDPTPPLARAPDLPSSTLLAFCGPAGPSSLPALEDRKEAQASLPGSLSPAPERRGRTVFPPLWGPWLLGTKVGPRRTSSHPPPLGLPVTTPDFGPHHRVFLCPTVHPCSPICLASEVWGRLRVGDLQRPAIS